MARNSFPKVSIIFSNLNGGEEPLECLASIQKLTYPKAKIETIVIDNSSTDGSPENIEKKFPKVKLMKLKAAIGLPASLNLGIKNSTGRYIFICNDDVVLAKDSISKMLDYFKRNTNIGVLGGSVFYKNNPTLLIESAPKFNFYLGLIKKSKASLRPREAIWLQSCAIMVPKAVFDHIGLFDEGYYPLYFDDFDFCLRAKKAGYKIIHYPDAFFWHGEGKTTDKVHTLQKHYWWYKNRIRFLFKNATPLQIISAIIYQFVIISGKTIYTRRNYLWTFIKALTENISNLPSIIKLRTIPTPKNV